MTISQSFTLHCSPSISHAPTDTVLISPVSITHLTIDTFLISPVSIAHVTTAPVPITIHPFTTNIFRSHPNSSMFAIPLNPNWKFHVVLSAAQ